MLNLKYKFYRSKKNKQLEERIRVACSIWNHCLSLQKRYYKMYKKYIDVNKMQKHISKLRKNNTYWLKLNSQSVQEICQRQDQAFQRFFKKITKRPPKFKKYQNFNSFVFKNSGWKIDNNKFTITKVGTFKFSNSREYKNIKRITIKRGVGDEYFLVLTCDIESERLKRVGKSTIGMDFGLKTYLTCSNGEKIESPQFLKQDLKRLKQANKELSSKKFGSNNRKKAKVKVAKIHQDIANKRSDFEWKLTHKLCKNNVFIAIEDLNLEGMKKLWGRKVSDLAFASFVLKLEQVAKKYDSVIVKIDRFYPSSKLCTCGYKNKDLKLSDRTWICPVCNKKHDRDVLAAKNILTEGIRLYCTKNKTTKVAS